MENLPVYIHLIFIGVTALSVYLFYKAIRPSAFVLVSVLLWLLVQAVLSFNGFYSNWNTAPPRIVFLLFPPLLMIALVFLIPKLRKHINVIDGKLLTRIHVVRIPVEFTLLLLFLNGGVPQLMTFEGRNFDILSGITAPLIIYYGYAQKRVNRGLLLAWNFICLGLLLNIVVHAILAMPTPFQKLAFDQPNIAVAYFPFVWLPSFIVPLVLFAHLVAIRQLLTNKDTRLGKQASVIQQVATL